MPTPWSQERRDAVRRKIDKEADRAAYRLGASKVFMIAFFEEGEYLHLMEGGASPMPVKDLCEKILSALAMLEASGGEDISLS